MLNSFLSTIWPEYSPQVSLFNSSMDQQSRSFRVHSIQVEFNLYCAKLGEILVKARLEHYFKHEIRDRFLLELRIHRVDGDARYPDFLKYSLIFLEYKTGKKILMDNHHPKGPHFHLNDEEFPYTFVGIEKLIGDFKDLVLECFGEVL